MGVRDVATNRVEVVANQASVQHAAERMASLEIGAMPVIDDDEAVIGMISDRDITIRVVARGLDPATTAVSRAMTAEAVTLPPDAELDQAVDLMQQKQVRRLPLVNHDGHPVGILALADLATRLDAPDLAARALAAISKPTRDHSSNDA